MSPLTYPRRVAQMPFIWGNIVATPPGHYNSFKSHSLYIKNIEKSVSQAPFPSTAIVAKKTPRKADVPGLGPCFRKMYANVPGGETT